LFSDRLIKDCDAELFTMPSLEDEKNITREDLLREAEEIQRKAYEEGYAAGEKAGRSEGERQAALLVEKAGRLLSELVEFKKNFVETLESQVLDLSFAIAEKVIATEIETRPEVVVNVVRESLRRLSKSGRITIKINPALQEIFNKSKPELTDIHEDIVFELNSNIPVSGPMVISETEEVVTDIKSLLANISEEMRATEGHDV
jgi:flagellar assembly protein FliH